MLAALIFTVLLIPAFASAKSSYKNLLLLGDSITYGYGLEGDRDVSASYGNLLRDYLGIGDADFTNAAVNGYRSADLAALLPLIEDKVASADIIVISIGGNDLLEILWRAVSEVVGDRWSYAELVTRIDDPEFIGELSERIKPETITGAIVDYSANLALIVNYIRKANGGAEVIFLSQYDPTSGAGMPEEVEAVGSGAIALLNLAMESIVTEGGCTYLDIHTPFKGKARLWTNITDGDIHPNKTGHEMIYLYIINFLETGPHPALTSDSNLETEPTFLPSSDMPESDTDGVPTKTKKRGCGGSVAGFALVLLALFSSVIISVRE